MTAPFQAIPELMAPDGKPSIAYLMTLIGAAAAGYSTSPSAARQSDTLPYHVPKRAPRHLVQPGCDHCPLLLGFGATGDRSRWRTNPGTAPMSPDVVG